MIKEQFLGLITKYSIDTTYNIQCWEEISERYNSKSRHYHNLQHLQNMLAELEEVCGLIKELDTVLFAIYYHDIIYKATQSNNEHKSALFFKERISKTNFSAIEDCYSQIEATKEHLKSECSDTNFLLDIDLSILGKSEKEYNQYCQNIRKEYSIFPDFMYRKGRRIVLKKMLDIESIYKTEYFNHKYEQRAKENIDRELKEL